MHWAKYYYHKCAHDANILETSNEEKTKNEFEMEDNIYYSSDN